MAITVIGRTNGTGDPTIAISQPSHIATDLLLVFVGANAIGAPTSVTSGWSQIDRDVFTDGQLALFGKLANGTSDPMTSTWGGEKVAYSAFSIRGHNVTDVTSIPVFQTTGNAATISFPAASGLNAGKTYLSILGQAGEDGDTSANAAPSGWSNYVRARHGTLGSHGVIVTADRIVTGVTSLSPANVASSDDGDWASYQVIIEEYVAPALGIPIYKGAAALSSLYVGRGVIDDIYKGRYY